MITGNNSIQNNRSFYNEFSLSSNLEESDKKSIKFNSFKPSNPDQEIIEIICIDEPPTKPKLTRRKKTARLNNEIQKLSSRINLNKIDKQQKSVEKKNNDLLNLQKYMNKIPDSKHPTIRINLTTSKVENKKFTFHPNQYDRLKSQHNCRNNKPLEDGFIKCILDQTEKSKTKITRSPQLTNKNVNTTQDPLIGDKTNPIDTNFLEDLNLDNLDNYIDSIIDKLDDTDTSTLM